MKVAVFNTKPHDREYLDIFNKDAGHSFTYFDAALCVETANLASGHEAVCLFVNDITDKKVIGILSQLGVKLIVLRCAGFNNVDLQSSADNGMTVVRVPAYSPQAVAEHSVALIMTLNRKTHKAYNRTRESNFSLDKLKGFNLYQKTVGVIGTGKIGAAFCRIMAGFGCTVIAHDIKESEELKQAGVTYLSLEEVLRQSAIISLHCPLSPATTHMINAAAFAMMKPGVMLINTSRGALIDTAAAIHALKSGHLGYLGIDVYEQEEKMFFKDLSESIISDDVFERLMSFHNVLITPHQAFFTHEALEQIAITTIKNISDFEKGLPAVNEVRFKMEDLRL